MPGLIKKLQIYFQEQIPNIFKIKLIKIMKNKAQFVFRFVFCLSFLTFLIFIIGCGEMKPSTNVGETPRSSEGTPNNPDTPEVGGPTTEPGEPEPPTVDPDPPLPDPEPSLNEVCYLICFQLISFEELLSPEDYEYKDPFQHESFPQGFNKNQYVAPKNLIELKTNEQNFMLAHFFEMQELMPLRQGGYGLFSKKVLERLDLMRKDLEAPILIHSAFRSPAYNASLSGSASWSRHQYGDAIDFHVPDVEFSQLKTLCETYGASFVQLYNSHVHCDWRNTPLDDEFYAIDNVENKLGNKALEDKMRRNTYKTLKRNSKIQVEDKGDYYKLFVISNFIEDDPVDIKTEWTLQYKRNRKIKLNQQQLFINKGNEPLSVSVNWGGSLILIYKFKK